MLIEGRFAAGEKLSEQQIATELEISRNTLREVFRLLTSQGLLTHISQSRRLRCRSGRIYGDGHLSRARRYTKGCSPGFNSGPSSAGVHGCARGRG
ncbi:GntR family transcriptional regulator [Sinorhizobium fredii]|uniref:GntR family transcriptional regulator n=1 Tax=Rhizobium fredii TaxID=380 RepID=UPI003511DCA0